MPQVLTEYCPGHRRSSLHLIPEQMSEISLPFTDGDYIGEDRQINKQANIMVNAGRKIKQVAGLVGGKPF